jgi:hypothetical protein
MEDWISAQKRYSPRQLERATFMQNGHDVNTSPMPPRLRLLLGYGMAVVCLLCAGCSSTPSPVEITDSLPQDGEKPAQNESVSAARRGLNWLAAKQNKDGTWGGPGNRVALTSLATWAFQSRGETPASDEYGKTVEDGLVVLVKMEDDSNLSLDTRVILVGCLADSYSLTRIPLVLSCLRKHLAALPSEDLSPWHVAYAANSARFSSVGEDWARQAVLQIRAAPPSRDAPLLDQASRLLLFVFIDLPEPERTLELAAVRTLDPSAWRKSERPLMTAFMLCKALEGQPSEDRLNWSRDFYPDMYGRQQVRGAVGWWTPSDLGVAGAKEFAGMSDDESAIYSTAMMIMSCPWTGRCLPSF